MARVSVKAQTPRPILLSEGPLCPWRSFLSRSQSPSADAPPHSRRSFVRTTSWCSRKVVRCRKWLDLAHRSNSSRRRGPVRCEVLSSRTGCHHSHKTSTRKSSLNRNERSQGIRDQRSVHCGDQEVQAADLGAVLCLLDACGRQMGHAFHLTAERTEQDHLNISGTTTYGPITAIGTSTLDKITSSLWCDMACPSLRPRRHFLKRLTVAAPVGQRFFIPA